LVLPWINSIGLNEQELHILHHYVITGEEAMSTNAHPNVAQVTQQLSEVIFFSKQNNKKKGPLGQLTRIHFHTLQFHIICQTTTTTTTTTRTNPWQSPINALLQSALMSTKLACGKKKQQQQQTTTTSSSTIHSSDMEIDPEKVEILLPRKILLHQKK
jgi:ADP-dependent glucokinase